VTVPAQPGEKTHGGAPEAHLCVFFKESGMNKSELLDGLQEKDRQWQALLDQVGPARMEQPGVNGDWSMKDLIAHLTGWNRRILNSFQAAVLGQPEPPPPWPVHLQAEDDINAWIYTANHGRALREVLDETRQVNQQIRTVIAGLPNDARIERVEPSYYLVWVGDQRFEVGEFYDHFYDEHEADVRAWLEKVGNH
jgi:hypothetical protein